jgi:hypothetical protein
MIEGIIHLTPPKITAETTIAGISMFNWLFMVSETITGLNNIFKILLLVTDLGFKDTLTICLFFDGY